MDRYNPNFHFQRYIVDGLDNSSAKEAFDKYLENLKATFIMKLKPQEHLGEERISQKIEAEAQPENLWKKSVLRNFFQIQCIKKKVSEDMAVIMHFLWYDFGCYHRRWLGRSNRPVLTDAILASDIANDIRKKIEEAMRYFNHKYWECPACPRRFNRVMNDMSSVRTHTLRQELGRNYQKRFRASKINRPGFCTHFRLQTGIHFCICGKSFRGHNSFIAHILPTTISLPHIPGTYRANYLDTRRMCSVSLLYMILLSSRPNFRSEPLGEGLEYSYLCACGLHSLGLFNWLYHVAGCFKVRIWLRTGCPFCPMYYGPLEPSVVNLYSYEIHQFTVDHSFHDGPTDWRNFYKFFIRGATPAKFVNYLDFYEGLARATLRSVPFNLDRNYDHIQARRNFEDTFKSRMSEFDERYRNYPYICTECHVRRADHGGHHEGSVLIQCPEFAHQMHVCRCGQTMENHWDYWLHTFIACRFYTSIHLMLFILSSNRDRLPCVCNEQLLVTDIDSNICHFMMCQQFVHFMLLNCPFCSNAFKNSEREPGRITTELIDRILILKEQDLTFNFIRRLPFILNDSMHIPRMIAMPPNRNVLNFLDENPIQIPRWVPFHIAVFRSNLRYFPSPVEERENCIVDNTIQDLCINDLNPPLDNRNRWTQDYFEFQLHNYLSRVLYELNNLPNVIVNLV